MTIDTPAQTATVEADAVQDTTPGSPASGPANTVDSLPDWAQAIIKDARSEAAKYRTEKKQAEMAAQDAANAQLLEQQEYKTLYENEKQARLDAEQKAQQAERAKLKTDVALRFKELPAELVDRLRGETEEELEADARALLEAMQPGKPKAPNLNGGAGGGERPGEKAIQLTPEEIEQARKMGVSLENYQKNKLKEK